MSISSALHTGVLFAQEVNVSEEAAEACNQSRLCAFFLDRTDNAFLSQLLGVLIPDIVRTVTILALAWLLVRVVRRVIRRVVRDIVERDQQRANGTRRRLPLAATQSLDPARAAMRTETLGTVMRSVASIVIWGAAVFVAVGSLRTADIDLGPLIAGAGIVGVALGFGAQSLVKDFLTGIFMLLEDQYGVGDIVDVGPATGVVEGITLRTTRLRDVEGVLWHVPNGEISRVGNLSQQWSRSLLDIPVAYDTDLDQAIDVIKETSDELWRDHDWRGLILEEPDVWGVEAFGDSAILIRVVVKVVPAQQWAVSRELRMRIKAAFDDVGIEIPFTTYSVQVRQDGDDPQPEPALSAAGGHERQHRERQHRGRARTGEYDSAPPDTAQDHDGSDSGDGERS
ncbi:MAG TPA: mechanosensitive ion channel family protein [Euzebyales bacterium]|nr:mechanosensitive ion channel family protein [Euzebyales bacterium]